MRSLRLLRFPFFFADSATGVPTLGNFFWLFNICMVVVFSASGLGIALSAFLSEQSALIVGIMLPLAFGGLLSGVTPTYPELELRMGPGPVALLRLGSYLTSAARFSTEAITTMTYETYTQHTGVKFGHQEALDALDYPQTEGEAYWKCIYVLVLQGIFYRLLGWAGMYTQHNGAWDARKAAWKARWFAGWAQCFRPCVPAAGKGEGAGEGEGESGGEGVGDGAQHAGPLSAIAESPAKAAAARLSHHYKSARPMTDAEMMKMADEDVWKTNEVPDEVAEDDSSASSGGAGMELVNLGGEVAPPVVLTPPPRRTASKKNWADADQVHVEVK